MSPSTKSLISPNEPVFLAPAVPPICTASVGFVTPPNPILPPVLKLLNINLVSYDGAAAVPTLLLNLKVSL